MKNSGFTLVETLVSLFIVSIVLAATFAIITAHLRNATLMKNSFIASGLAQEGAEIVRNLRDSDWFAGNDFGSLSDGGPTVSEETYCVQWDSPALISSCPGPLKKDNLGFYNYDSGEDTIFTRTVTVKLESTEELQIIVEVKWPDRGGIKSVVAEEHLFNWYEEN